MNCGFSANESAETLNSFRLWVCLMCLQGAPEGSKKLRQLLAISTEHYFFCLLSMPVHIKKPEQHLELPLWEMFNLFCLKIW